MRPPHNVSYLEKALRALAGTDGPLLGWSDRFRINFDIGHYVAANDDDPLAFVRKYHDNINKSRSPPLSAMRLVSDCVRVVIVWFCLCHWASVVSIQRLRERGGAMPRDDGGVPVF